MKNIYVNGNVYTGDKDLKEAFVVENGKFVMTGTDSEARAVAEEGDVITDLGKKFVSAGFNDSHMHLLSYGNLLNSADLTKCTDSIKSITDYLKQYIEKNQLKAGQWLHGSGWNQDFFTDEKRMINRYDLDKVSEDIPICISRVCGHCLCVNTIALKILGMEGDEKYSDGIFYENDMLKVLNNIPLPTKEQLKKNIIQACKLLNSYGITSCQSDDYCEYRKMDYREIDEAFLELEKEGKLSVKVYEQCNLLNLDQVKEFVEYKKEFEKKNKGYYRLGPLKLIGDGSLGARSAYLLNGYNDSKDTKGIAIFDQKTLDEIIDFANRNNWQVAIHAIGDGCLQMALDSFEKALKNHKREDHRHGIVHCQISNKDQLDKIAELGLYVYCQTIFLDYDIDIVEDRVGKELASTSYNFKTLLKKGVNVSDGSDCPVEKPDVLAGIQCAVTRKKLNGQKDPYLKDEAFTVKEALDSYTIKGAYASFEENKKGYIKQGMDADFVILSQSPFNTEPEKIKEIKVCETYVDGVLKYRA